MNLIELTLKNFKCYSYAHLNFNCANLFCITGKNNGNENCSNGTGKSTIFEAIDFVLTGFYKSKTIDEIVRFGQKTAEVQVVFKENGDLYRVTRSRNKKTQKSSLEIEINKNDNWESLTQRKDSDSEIELKKLTKISHNSFCNAIHFSHENMQMLASSSSVTEKQKIFKELFNLQVYSLLQKETKQDLSEVLSSLKEIQYKIDSLRNPDVSELILQISKNEEDLKNFLSQKDSLNSEINLSVKELSILQSQKPSLEKENLLIEYRNSKRNKQLELNNTKKTLASKQKEYELKKNSFEENNNAIKKLKEELETLKNKKFESKDSILNSINRLNSEIVEKKSLLLKTDERISELKKPLPDGAICPECKQILTLEHREKCKILISNEIEELTSSKKSLILNINDLEKQQDFFQSKLKEISDTESNINFITNSIENKRETAKSIKELGLQINQIIKKIEEDICSLNNEISDISKKEDELKKTIKEDELNNINEKITLKEKEIEKKRDQFLICVQNISKKETEISFMNKQLSEENEKIIKLSVLNISKNELNLKLKTLRNAEKSFHPTEIPTDIVSQILPHFQKNINAIASSIKPQLEFLTFPNDENLIEFESRKNGKKINYPMLSESEKFTSNISFIIGAADVQRERFDVNHEFLLLDEIDQSLDKESLNNFWKLINILKQRYKLFIITHNEWLKEKVNNYIIVNFDEENGSTASIEERVN